MLTATNNEYCYIPSTLGCYNFYDPKGEPKSVGDLEQRIEFGCRVLTMANQCSRLNKCRRKPQTDIEVP